jgi:hypothetical protein
MRLASSLGTVVTVLLVSCTLSAFSTTSAGAYTFRSPQVPLQTGWDGISLQSYLGSVGEGLNTLTEQLDLQTWQVGSSGTATFNLRMEIAGYAGSNNIGIYNAGEASPVKFLVFPGAAAAGWFATCSFGVGGNLSVSLYDNSSSFQGSTNYTGVDRNNFGFYLEGPAGTFYSQDVRNAGGKPQVLTYAGTGPYAGRWWECFEDLPYASSDVDFQDSILLLQSVGPVTPTLGSSWGSLKALYR